MAKSELPEGMVIRRSAHAVRLDMPIRRADQEVVAWARLFYAEHDPISVDVQVCALDGVPVLERAVHRRDLTIGLRREVWCASARMRPANKNEMAFEFLEASSRVEMDIPRIALERFIEATEHMVRPEEEQTALIRGVDRLLRMAGVAPSHF